MIAPAKEGKTYRVEVYSEGRDSDGMYVTRDIVEDCLRQCLEEGYDLISIAMSNEERLTAIVGYYEDTPELDAPSE